MSNADIRIPADQPAAATLIDESHVKRYIEQPTAGKT